MNGASDPHSPITATERAEFARDGVVCLRSRFDPSWIARLRDASDELLRERIHTVDYTGPGQPGRFAALLFMWFRHPVFHEFAFRSPAAAIAGELMAASKLNLMSDQVLVKEPGTREPTHWHHDLPFWPLAGTQVCSIWLALDPVTRDTGGVEFVAGSHRWPYRFRPLPLVTPALASKRNMDLPPCPSFDDRRDSYRILSWDLAPGDCIVFDALVIHGAGGNASANVRRRAVVTRWCGDDVTFVDGDHILELPTPSGLTTGARLDSPIFPVVWRRSQPSP